MKRKRLCSVIIMSLLLVWIGGACSGGGRDDYPYPTLAPDWSNWTSEEMPGGYGGGINLWKSAGGDETNSMDAVGKNVMLDGEVTVNDGILDVFLRYCFTEGEYSGEETMNTVVLVTVNDEICDFVLGGKRSQNGLLITEKSMDINLSEALTVADCSLVKGDNELAVHVAVYFPSGHSFASSVSRIFVSEVEKECSTNYGCEVGTLSGSEVVTSEGKDDREIRHWLGKTGDFLYEKISFDESKRCMTVGTDSAIKMSFPNTRGETGAVERQAIVLVLRNGQPVGVWDGETIGCLSLGEEDLNVTLPLTIEKKVGEYAHLSFVFFDGEEDMGTFVTERLFYFQ